MFGLPAAAPPKARGLLGLGQAPLARGALGFDHAPPARGPLRFDHAPLARGALGFDHAPLARAAFALVFAFARVRAWLTFRGGRFGRAPFLNRGAYT